MEDEDEKAVWIAELEEKLASARLAYEGSHKLLVEADRKLAEANRRLDSIRMGAIAVGEGGKSDCKLHEMPMHEEDVGKGDKKVNLDGSPADQGLNYDSHKT